MGQMSPYVYVYVYVYMYAYVYVYVNMYWWATLVGHFGGFVSGGTKWPTKVAHHLLISQF